MRTLVASPPLPRRNEDIIAAKIGGYWESTEARNLFSPSSRSGGLDIIVSLRMVTLKSMINNPRKVKQYVQNYNEESELSMEEIIYMSQKATYLYYAYEIVMRPSC